MAEEIKKEVDLDQPFGEDPTPDGTETQETEIREIGADDKVPAEEVEKPKVPYSRFENVSRARREAEAEAEKWRQRAIELEERKFTPQAEASPEKPPQWWLENYGDNEGTRKAWANQYQHEQELLSTAEQRAYERLQKSREQEQLAERENLKSIDDGLEDLSLSLGRDLTEKEQSELLDIVDDYTPKGADGKYLGATIPFNKAWEIYELKQKSAKAPSRQSRDSVASVISSPSSGQPNPEQQERNKNFQPGRWGSWMNRLPEDK